MKEFIKNLRFIFKPSYWFMNNRYDKSVDEMVNYLIDNYDFTEVNRFSAVIGGVKLWTGNIPYSCMHLYESDGDDTFRPSRLTIEKAINKMNADRCRLILNKANKTK